MEKHDFDCSLFIIVRYPQNWSFETTSSSQPTPTKSVPEAKEPIETKTMDSIETKQDISHVSESKTDESRASSIARLFALNKETSLTNNKALNNQLVSELNNKLRSDRNYQKMHQTRQGLPAFAVQKNIVGMYHQK